MPEASNDDSQQTDQQTEPADRTFTQEDVNRLLAQERRTQESRFAGYDELKAKADQFDQLEEANRTELERATARAEKAEKDLAASQAAQLRMQVAAAAKLPADMASRLQGDTAEELEADAEKLAELLTPERTESGREGSTAKGGPFTLDLSGANSNGEGGGVNDAQARSFFGI